LGNGDDLRRDPLAVRKAMLASIVAKASPGIRFNEHIEGDGPTVFAHACKMGLEGVRNIHSAQGVFSNGVLPGPWRGFPRPRPTSLWSATQLGGVLVCKTSRRIFRFCAAWLERVMQAIAEGPWPPSVKS
jgi:hypothetical protein